jgi:hypothetical protein
VPATFTFTGSAASVGEGEGPSLLVEYRPTGGIGCQATFANDRQAAGGPSTVLAGTDDAPWNKGDDFEEDPPTVGPGTFTVPLTYGMPSPGSYLFCAYLEYKGNVEAATSLAVNVTPPDVSVFAVGLPAAAQPGKVFVINYTTQTDQQLTLVSLIQHAGGLPCAASPELDEQQNQAQDHPAFAHEEEFSHSLKVFGGPIVNQATDTETAAGSYIICSWITGPNSGEVDAALTTPFYVGTPPPPPPPPPAPSAACLRDRHNVTYEVGFVHHYLDKLKTRHLSRKSRRRDAKILARARTSLRRDEGFRHRQCPSGR